MTCDVCREKNNLARRYTLVLCSYQQQHIRPYRFNSADRAHFEHFRHVLRRHERVLPQSAQGFEVAPVGDVRGGEHGGDVAHGVACYAACECVGGGGGEVEGEEAAVAAAAHADRGGGAEVVAEMEGVVEAGETVADVH